MSDKENKIPQAMSEEEEEIQRALGTLKKFMISVERKKSTKTFAHVYVLAIDEDGAKKRAMKIVNDDSRDDTKQPVSWADNMEGVTGKAKVDEIHTIDDDDARAHRFTGEGAPDEEDETPFETRGHIIV